MLIPSGVFFTSVTIFFNFDSFIYFLTLSWSFQWVFPLLSPSLWRSLRSLLQTPFQVYCFSRFHLVLFLTFCLVLVFGVYFLHLAWLSMFVPLNWVEQLPLNLKERYCVCHSLCSLCWVTLATWLDLWLIWVWRTLTNCQSSRSSFSFCSNCYLYFCIMLRLLSLWLCLLWMPRTLLIKITNISIRKNLHHPSPHMTQ